MLKLTHMKNHAIVMTRGDDVIRLKCTRGRARVAFDCHHDWIITRERDSAEPRGGGGVATLLLLIGFGLGSALGSVWTTEPGQVAGTKAKVPATLVFETPLVRLRPVSYSGRSRMIHPWSVSAETAGVALCDQRTPAVSKHHAGFNSIGQRCSQIGSAAERVCGNITRSPTGGYLPVSTCESSIAVAAPLRVFYGEPERDPAAITLREAFLRHLFPSLDGRRAKSTPRQYRTALSHWETFCDQRASTNSTRAPDLRYQVQPVDLVSQITDAMLNDFGAWLMGPKPTSPELSLASAKKQWKFIRAILRRIGPREAGNPRAVGLIDRVPVMDPLDHLDQCDDAEGPVDLSNEQLGKIYEACDIATWPHDQPVLQWQTYLVIASVMGPRVDDTARLTADDFRFDPASPVQHSVRTYDDGWLVYVPSKTKAKKRGRLIIPLPPCVNVHVRELIRRRSGRLFSWRNSTSHRFTDQWQLIVKQAGLDHVQRRNLRSPANIRWTRAGSGNDLGRWVLGHAARDVNDAHYMRVEPELIEAAPIVEVPQQFSGPLRGSTTQHFLF